MFLVLWVFSSQFEDEIISTVDPLKCFTSRLTTSSSTFFVYYCIFKHFSITGNGGVISFNNIVVNSLIRSSIFYSCSSTGIGGGIYFNCQSGGGSILRNVCAFSCTGGNVGWETNSQFATIATSLTKINQIFFSSISQCAPAASDSRYTTINMRFGIQSGSNVNSTNNYVYYASGFRTDSPVSCSYSFFTIANNFASHRHCFYVLRGSGIRKLEHSNLIGNNSPYDGGIVFAIYSVVFSVSDCIFYNNLDCLFFAEASCSISVSNTVADHDYTLKSGPVSTNNISTTFIQTWQLLNFHSHVCNTDRHITMNINRKTIFLPFLVLYVLFPFL